MKRHERKNEELKKLIKELKKKAIQEKKHLYRRLAIELEKPRRSSAIVNLYKIEKYARDGETVFVPGKVLGTGDLSKKVRIIAYKFSYSAMDKLLRNNIEFNSFKEFISRNLDPGKSVRIIK